MSNDRDRLKRLAAQGDREAAKALKALDVRAGLRCRCDLPPQPWPEAVDPNHHDHDPFHSVGRRNPWRLFEIPGARKRRTFQGKGTPPRYETIVVAWRVDRDTGAHCYHVSFWMRRSIVNVRLRQLINLRWMRRQCGSAPGGGGTKIRPWNAERLTFAVKAAIRAHTKRTLGEKAITRHGVPVVVDVFGPGPITDLSS